MTPSRPLITRADYVVLAAATVLVGTLYSTWSASGGDASVVRVGVTGQTEQVLELTANQTLTLHGPLGDSVIEIKDGRARFTRSPCDNKQCIHSGWLGHAGDFAACLPNRVTLFIAGSDTFDAINF